MSQAPEYNPTESFADDATNQVSGRSGVLPAALDAELVAIAASINALTANLELIQRDDGHIRDSTVEPYTLSTATLTYIASLSENGFVPRGAWLTATAYVVGDLVTNSAITYVCATAHTSGTFATDLAANKWVAIAYSGTISSFMQTVLDDTTAAAARTTLGVTDPSAFMATVMDDANAAAARATLAAAGSGAITASGITMTTNRVIGRTTASTGAPEELYVAAPLRVTVGQLELRDLFNKRMQNLAIDADVDGSGNMVITVSASTGAALSSTLNSRIAFRSSPNADGTSVEVTGTGNKTLTIPSGAELGTADGVPSRIWIGILNTATGAGTDSYVAAVYNARSGSDIIGFDEDVLVNTTVLNTSSDSAGVWYTPNAGYTGRAINVIGYLESTQATKGSWLTAPTKVVTNPRRRPGDVVQSVISQDGTKASGSTTMPRTSAPQNTDGDQYMSKAITPTSSANVLEIEHVGQYANSGSANLQVALFQDSTAACLKAAGFNIGTTSGRATVAHTMVAATASSTTFKVRAGPSAGTVYFNGTEGNAQMFSTATCESHLKIVEIFA